MAQKSIAPGGSLCGSLELPGDKSISHRYALLAALAQGASEIHHFSAAADCRSTLECLRRLGVAIEVAQDSVRIAGAGLEGFKAPRRKLDAENSGTTMRLLAGLLAGQNFSATITGDSSLRRRPMRRVIEPLSRMGAQIESRDGGRAPLEIHGARLRSIDYTLPLPSAQVKSAVLLAGLYAEGVTVVRESVRTRDHTEIALREFGADIDASRGAIHIHPRPKLRPRRLIVPGDLSAAVFFLAAASILPGSSLLLHNVGLNPTRTRILDVLVSMGAAIHLAAVQMRDGELLGDVSVRSAALAGGTISGSQVPELIDELPMLAALGPFTEKGIDIRDAQELRFKESDRVAVLAEGLRRMGARVKEFPDGLRVEGRAAGKLRGAALDPRGDHRIAMAFSIAALAAGGPATIRGAECVGVSFPEFFDALDRLRGASGQDDLRK